MMPKAQPAPTSTTTAPTSTKVVAVFTMPGCPACKEYLPRFKAEGFKHLMALGQRNILHIDISDTDKKATGFADKYKIEATPTTLVFSATGKVLKKVEGAIPNQQIAELFAFALT